MSYIRAVADYRGTFEQGERTTLLLKITSFDGEPTDPTTINVYIRNSDGDLVESGIPEKVADGFYIYDWDIADEQQIGEYTIKWVYVIDGEESEVIETAVVAGDGEIPPASPYADFVASLRASLDLHLSCAQSIPVYNEPGIIDEDMKTVNFNYDKWNQNAHTQIYLNHTPVTSGATIYYFRGKIIFDNPVTKYDEVNASYNFRWFTDRQLDRFLQNSLHVLNIYPPQTKLTIQHLGTPKIIKYIPVVLYGAAKDALRELLMCLQFQETKEIFGGEEAAEKAFSNLEKLKKNYEEETQRLLEQKKYGPYVGLTKTVITPEFTLPGGRSRWFRYLMGGFAL